MIPMRLSCQCCDWRSGYAPLENVIALYLFHMVSDHWEVLQKAHDNPVVMAAASYLLG